MAKEVNTSSPLTLLVCAMALFIGWPALAQDLPRESVIDVPAICVFDESVQAVVVDGAVIPCRSQRDDFGVLRMELESRLGAGEHTITVKVL